MEGVPMISNTAARTMANQLSVACRHLLILHIDKKFPLDRNKNTQARNTLLNRELIKYTQVSGAAATNFPTHTALTEIGRAVVCAVLAEYAEAIVNAGDFLERMSSPPISAPSPETIQAAFNAEELLAAGWTASRVL